MTQDCCLLSVCLAAHSDQEHKIQSQNIILKKAAQDQGCVEKVSSLFVLNNTFEAPVRKTSVQTFSVSLGTGPTNVKIVAHCIHKQHILLLAIIFLPKILYILYLFSKVGFSIHDQCAEKAKTMSKLMI